MNDHGKKTSRRSFLRQLSFGAAAGSFLALCRTGMAGEVGGESVKLTSGHRSALPCTDTSNLTQQQIQTRKTLKYVDDSPHPEMRCNNCRFFEAAESDEECGGCQVVPGPIHPRGYCTAWAATAGRG